MLSPFMFLMKRTGKRALQAAERQSGYCGVLGKHTEIYSSQGTGNPEETGGDAGSRELAEIEDKTENGGDAGIMELVEIGCRINNRVMAGNEKLTENGSSPGIEEPTGLSPVAGIMEPAGIEDTSETGGDAGITEPAGIGGRANNGVRAGIGNTDKNSIRRKLFIFLITAIMPCACIVDTGAPHDALMTCFDDSHCLSDWECDLNSGFCLSPGADSPVDQDVAEARNIFCDALYEAALPCRNEIDEKFEFAFVFHLPKPAFMHVCVTNMLADTTIDDIEDLKSSSSLLPLLSCEALAEMLEAEL